MEAIHDMFPSNISNHGQMIISTYKNETFWSFHPRFWHKNIPYDPCRIRRALDTRIRRRYAPLTRRSICLRLDIALKRSICPAGQEGKGAIDTRCQRQHIEFRAKREIYRMVATRPYIELRSNISTHRRCFISSCVATYRQKERTFSK